MSDFVATWGHQKQVEDTTLTYYHLLKEQCVQFSCVVAPCFPFLVLRRNYGGHEFFVHPGQKHNNSYFQVIIHK